MILRLWLAGLVFVAGCGNTSGREVFVSAAASLTDAFTELELQFEEQHPDIDIVLNFGGSSALREQILAGAPVDIFASANEENMDQVVGSGFTTGAATPFASNRLTIAVPVDNPGAVTGLADLAREELLIGLCGPSVPCGALARDALANAGVEPAVDTNEPDVRALLTKIGLGELDAGIVYATDVLDGEVGSVAIPTGDNVEARYPIAIVRNGRNSRDGALFIEFVLGPEGQQVLRDQGFGQP